MTPDPFYDSEMTPDPFFDFSYGLRDTTPVLAASAYLRLRRASRISAVSGSTPGAGMTAWNVVCTTSSS